jgi:hypothetical protein
MNFVAVPSWDSPWHTFVVMPSTHESVVVVVAFVKRWVGQSMPLVDSRGHWMI